MTTFGYRATFALFAAVYVTSAGCPARYQLETAKVAGRVTLDGKPVPQGSVIFVPDAGRGGKGLIGPDGSFTLGTYGNEDGAVIGPHRIAVMAIATAPRMGKGAPPVGVPPWIVPERYTNADLSGLNYEVKAGVDNFVRLDLKSDEQSAP